MTFPVHGLIACAPTMWILSRMKQSRATIITFGIITFILGTINDTLDWILSVSGLITRWSVYGWFHHDSPAWLNILVYPIGLHNAIDSYIHLFPGYNWWYDYWWLEVGCWVASGLLIWVSLRRNDS